jgi:hypothetical protein
MLLSPVFFINSIYFRAVKAYLIIIGIMVFYWTVHISLPISPIHYLKSSLITLINIAFLTNCYHYFKNANELCVSSIFKKIVYLNFCLVILALIAFFIPVLKPVFWYLIPITKGSGIVPRLKMFQSEASVYSLIMAPFFLYFFFHYFKDKKNLFSISFFSFLVLPLLLSFSFGVGLVIGCSIIVTIIFFHKYLLSQKVTLQFISITVILFMLMASWVYLDNDNLVVLRLRNILSGSDTSAKGRTIESFALASKVLTQYDSWFFGIGPGQFKILGKELLLSFYQYSGNVTDIRIPNACADTLIVYGMMGLTFRIVLQIILFFRTRVYQNHYRFALFVFLFIYQFTGSYYNNLIEWTIWVLAFSPAFKQFEIKKTSTTEYKR